MAGCGTLKPLADRHVGEDVVDQPRSRADSARNVSKVRFLKAGQPLSPTEAVK